MAETAISRDEFERRTAALFVGGVGPGLPRKRRDRHILLKGAAVALGHGRTLTEAALNDELERWLAALGPAVRLDHVSLRRYLIDEGFLVRDPAGKRYSVCSTEDWAHVFEPSVDDVDVAEVVRRELAEREQRRSLHEGRG
jgi:hypothetical protein